MKDEESEYSIRVESPESELLDRGDDHVILADYDKIEKNQGESIENIEELSDNPE